MKYLKINDKKIGPYIWIKKSSWEITWDILPIIYDESIIELKWVSTSYSLCYKISKNLLWKEINYADLVDEKTWETFSFQVSNIFVIKIIKNDIKLIASVWNELKFFENFWKKSIKIENDWDKRELTPLWDYDSFIAYDNDYYYPIILNEAKLQKSEIKRFFDYYWYKSYIDNSWESHVVMLIEHEKSDDYRDYWCFIDNFKIISVRLHFWSDTEYVEEWELDWNYTILMTLTSWKKAYILNWDQKIYYWNPPSNITKDFVFTRFFDDTDIDYIVWKNNFWYFIFDRNLISIDSKKAKSILYYKDFIHYEKDDKLFVVINKNDEIIILNEKNKEILTTDLTLDYKIKEIHYKNNNKVIEIVSIKESKEIKRDYIL